MSKKKITDNNFTMKILLKIIQETIKLFLFFLIPYIWASSYEKNKTYALILSMSLALLIEILSLIISRGKTNKKELKKAQQTEAEQMFLSLILEKKPIDFFCNLFSTRHTKIVKKSHHIIIEMQDQQRILFYPFLKIAPINEDNIIEISKLEQNINKILIICNTKTDAAQKLTTSIDKQVEILDKYQTYSQIYSEYDYYPKPAQQEKQKVSLKTYIKNIFEKQKAKGYIFAGIFLLLSSIYNPLSLYYKIVSSMLFLLATICLCQSKTKKELH